MMEWLTALLLGGAVGLDATSFPQAMYSRPFVAGALAGLAVNRPVEGAIIGALLEFFALPVLPFGAAGYPEGGTAAVGATAGYAWVAQSLEPNLLFLAVCLGLMLSHATGYSVRLLRIRNGWSVGRGDENAPIPPNVVERRHLLAMVLDFLRGALVTAAGTALIAVALALAVRAEWTLPIPPLNVIMVAVAMMIGGSMTIFGELREHVLSFAVGAGLTAVVLWVL